MFFCSSNLSPKDGQTTIPNPNTNNNPKHKHKHQYTQILLPDGLGREALHIYACLAIALLVMAIFTLLGTTVRERLLSRCGLFRIGAAISAGGIWGWFGLVRTHKPALLLAGDLVVLGVGLGLMHGAMDALLVEPFPTPIAYTGIAILYQATDAILHILYPSLAFWLLSLGESSPLHALRIAPGVNAIGVLVASLLLGLIAVFSVQYLKAYQRPVSLPPRGLRVRECIQISGDSPQPEADAVVINPDPSVASSSAYPSFRLPQREIPRPP